MHRYFASRKFLHHTIAAFILIYSLTCAIAYSIFLKTCWPFFYDWVGPWLLVSRGGAMATIALTALMLMLMARGLLTRVRGYVGWSPVLRAIVDNPTFSHITCGIVLSFAVGLHVLG